MPRRSAKAARPSVTRQAKEKANGRRCGLCGKARKLRRTECCGQWICDDEDSYVLFSYARNSCSRNHHRYSLCGHHFNEGHAGDWRTCESCRADIVTEMYVYYGTNAYNFEKLADPPAYEPTHCSSCNRVIKLAEEAYSMSGKGYTCSDCFSF